VNQQATNAHFKSLTPLWYLHTTGRTVLILRGR